MQPTIRFLPHVTPGSRANDQVRPGKASSDSTAREPKASSIQRPAAREIPNEGLGRGDGLIAEAHPAAHRAFSLLVRLVIVGLLFVLSFLLAGCASYVNSPAAEAHRAKASADFSHPLIARAYNAKPAMHYPASIGLAPMDGTSQIPLRAFDAAGKLDALKSLPQLANVTNVSSLLISSDGEAGGPVWNKSDLALREAAARLHCDAVLLLKIDTNVTDGKIFAPLTLATLGLFPNDRTEVISTALAALVDTRTGYVYATAERSAGKTCHAISWDDSTRDRTMRLANQKAMEKLFADFPALWAGIVAKHRS